MSHVISDSVDSVDRAPSTSMAPALSVDSVDETLAAPVLMPKEPAADQWPVLVPLDCQVLPTLDLERLPGFAGEFARAVSAATETPPELAAAMVLSACSTAAARRLHVLVKPGYFEPTNLWLVCALEPGNRKSAVLSASVRPLVEWERELGASMEIEIKKLRSELKTMEERAQHLRKEAVRSKDSTQAQQLQEQVAELESQFPEIPMPPQLWTSDATPERLGSLLAEHDECMAWLSAEGGLFDLVAGRYSNGVPNLDLMLKAHSGDAERVDRGSRPSVQLYHPALTLGLAPQPEVLRGLSSKPGFRGKGLLARFLYFLPRSPLGFRRLQTTPVSEEVADAYEAGIRAMLDWPAAQGSHGRPVPQVLRLTGSASRKLARFERVVEEGMRPRGRFEYIKDWAAKAPGAAARVAGVLHGIKHAHGEPWVAKITDETMQDAIEIVECAASHSLTALNLTGADPAIAAAEKVWSWIEGNQRNYFTIREAHQDLKGSFPLAIQLRKAFDTLRERGYIELHLDEKQSPGRKSSPVVKVRPDLARSWG